MKPFVSLLVAGGTIGERRNTSNIAVGAGIGAEQFLREISPTSLGCEVRGVDLPYKRSDDMSIADIVELSTAVTHELQSGAKGVVVTHGTDTLEETAFGLDLLVASDAPVVMTGAMRPHDDQGADGLANLRAALQVASASASRGTGTLVVFDQTIHAARFVHKVSTSSLHGFASRSCGPLGWIAEGRVRIPLRPSPQRRIRLHLSRVPEVAIAKAFIGGSGLNYEALSKPTCAGLVVEGFGGGHVPASTTDLLETLSASIPVAITTRVPEGEILRSTYGGIGDEVDLRRRGLMSGGILSAAKAHVLLSLLLMSEESLGQWSAEADTPLRQAFESIASGCPDQSNGHEA